MGDITTGENIIPAIERLSTKIKINVEFMHNINGQECPFYFIMEKPETTFFYRRNLPHWSVKNPAYFVTFRLKNTIPKTIFNRLQKEYEEALLQAEENSELKNTQRIYFSKMESILDVYNDNNNYLINPEIANIVIKAFEWIENKHKWQIVSYVIMPNHVHCLMLGDCANTPLEKSLKILKGYTAREANKILNRKGSFWAPESFDRWCRDQEEFEKVKKYIKNNPIKAGLIKEGETWSWQK